MGMRHTNRYKLINISFSSETLDTASECNRIPDETDYITVYKNEIAKAIGDFHTAEWVTVLDAQIERQPNEMFFLRVGSNVGHEGEIFDQTTRFSFRGVRGT